MKAPNSDDVCETFSGNHGAERDTCPLSAAMDRAAPASLPSENAGGSLGLDVQHNHVYFLRRTLTIFAGIDGLFFAQLISVA